MRIWQITLAFIITAQSVLAVAAPVSPGTPGASPAMIAAQNPNEWTKWLIKNQPTSIHAMLMEDNYQLRLDHGDACISAIKNHLNSGRNLYSNVLRKHSRPVSQFKNRETSDGVFFHYTKAIEVKSAAQKKDLSPVFQYIRTEDSFGFFDWYMYFATDPKSSRNYGPIQVQVKVDPRSLVFIPAEDDDEDEHVVQIEIGKELVNRNPALGACSIEHTLAFNRTILEALAVEASGISFIAYFGVDNEVTGAFEEGNQWLQLVGPWLVQDMSVR